jgi:hypothetical protein
MYVCMYVCMTLYISMCVCVRVCVHACIQSPDRAVGRGQVPSFSQLIGGIGWLVRNGSVYVDESAAREGIDPSFVTLLSARSAIGHDAEGRLIHVEWDGKSNERGIALPAFAQLLRDQYGLINAINLDGGGSVTHVTQGIVTSNPSYAPTHAPGPRPQCAAVCGSRIHVVHAAPTVRTRGHGVAPAKHGRAIHRPLTHALWVCGVGMCARPTLSSSVASGVSRPCSVSAIERLPHKRERDTRRCGPTLSL